MSLETAIAELKESLDRNSDLLEQNIKGRGEAIAAAEKLADKPAGRGRPRKTAAPTSEEAPREERDEGRSSRARDRGDDDRGSRDRDCRDDRDDRGGRSRDKEEAPRGRGRPSKNKDEITDDDLRAAFGAFMDVEDEKTRDDRKEFVLDMFDVLKVQSSIAIDQRDRADAIRYLDEELDGKFTKFN